MTAFQRVITHVTEKIDSGEWPSGFKLPSTAKLAEQLGISETWVNNALRSLQDRGIIEGRAGSGRFVL